MSRGVVLVRTADAEVQLQALRTAVSLSLGDRAADLLVSGEGEAVLRLPAESEAEHCLQTLRQLNLGIELDGGPAGVMVHHVAEVLSHGEFVARLADADFVQVF